jgi:GntR family transcriptional regulator, rspAB operon transcriptional repressor
MSGLLSFSASDLATERIRELINGDEMPPGTKINVEELALDFGVSRTPIRDALARLEAEGLVQVVPRVGVYVRHIPVTEVLEVYAVKEAVEPVMAQWAAERASTSEREAFYESVKKLRDLANSGDVPGYVNFVVERRLMLMEMARSGVLTNVFRSIDGRVRLLRFRNLHQPARIKASIREHAEIARAVRAGDGQLAYELTQKHVRSARESLVQLVRSEETPEQDDAVLVAEA